MSLSVGGIDVDSSGDPKAQNHPATLIRSLVQA
ncbi:hypothetical protein BH09ACT10_BH09ACT10_14250 [soil metagenome]